MATLIAITMNSIVAYVLLSQVISVKIEYTAVKNILCTTGVMAIFLLVIHFLLPLTHIIMLVGAVMGGCILYLCVTQTGPGNS